MAKIVYPFLGILTTLFLSIKIEKSKYSVISNFIEFCGENSLTFYLLEVFCGTVYRIILINVIPIEYNFFLLKLLSLYFVVKFIITRSSILSFLLGAKPNM